jgi:hypothetical protein
VRKFLLLLIFFLLVCGRTFAIGKIDIAVLGVFAQNPMNISDMIGEVNDSINEFSNAFSGDYGYVSNQPGIGVSVGFRYQWNSLLLRVDVGLLNTIKKANGFVQVSGKEKNEITVYSLGFFFFNAFGYSVFIKERDKVYIFVGPAGIYGYITVSVSSEGYSIKVFDSEVSGSYTYEASAFGFVYGVGGEIGLGKRVALSFDWVNYRGLASRVELPNERYIAFPLVGSMIFIGIIYTVPM